MHEKKTKFAIIINYWNKVCYKEFFVFISLLLRLSGNIVMAQKKIEPLQKGNPEKAMQLIKSGNFNSAIKEFELLVREEPDNLSYRAFLGYAYLSTNVNKTKAIPHFEMVVKDSKADPYAFYDLGRAYMLAYRFDDAIVSFEKFRKLLHDKEKDLPVSAKRMIEMCNQAKDIYKKRCECPS